MLVEVILKGDFREGRDEFLYAVISEDEGWYGEANPGEAIGEKCTGFLIPCEFKRELDEGKGEFLVINPLAAEEGCEAKESKIDEENQNYPGDEGYFPFPHPMLPSAPGESALIEFLSYLLLCFPRRTPRDEPSLYMREEELLPFIWHISIVILGNQKGDKLLKEPTGGNHSPHEHH